MNNVQALTEDTDWACVQAPHGPRGPNGSAEGHIATLADHLYRLRRRRDHLFAGGLFSEPTWDLLLDLLAAEGAGNRVSITSACIAAAAPTTTALRCLKQLEVIGAVYREPDPVDGRRTYLRLSADTIAKMETLFSDLAKSSRAADIFKKD